VIHDGHWRVQVASADGEILSSYLARSADAHGLSPYRFFAFFLPNIPIWNRDIDRSASDPLLAQIAAHSGLTVEQLSSMTLRKAEASFKGESRGGSLCGISPWINSLGIFHRDRRRHGMQYCAECLKVDRAFKREWRLSFVTVCPIHESPLADCCTHCDAPVMFHRNDTFGPNCRECGRSFAGHGSTGIPKREFDQRQMLQAFCLDAIETGKVDVAGQVVPASEFFRGLAIVLRLIKYKLRSEPASRPTPSVVKDCPRAQPELLRIEGRAKLCLMLAYLLEDWPSRLLDFATLRQAPPSVVGANQVPAWLHLTTPLFEATQTRRRKVATSPMRQKLRQIHRKKHPGWRTARAVLLFEAAGGRL